MTEPNYKIVLEHIYKVFGSDPQSVMPLIEKGTGKQEILEKHHHVIGIRDVSLQIRPGETFVVMGLSGSGKSTLIRHINRLIEPTAGRILVDGEDVLALNESELRELRRRKISMVFQRFALLPHRTVLDNVAYGLEISGLDRKAAYERAQAQIELVGLAGFEKRYPRQLSGGMQQRVGLARALATESEVLLMDEAFSALDPLIRNDMQDQLKDLQARLHKTIVFITHDLDEALRLGDHIAILKDGELRQVGSGEEILLDPADDYVKRFVRDVNRGRVVTIGSIAEPSPTLPLGQAAPDVMAHLLEQAGAKAIFLLDTDGRVAGVVSEDFLGDHRDQAKSWWQSVDNLAASPQADREAVIEDILPLLAGIDTPLAVTDANGIFQGSLSRQRALEALAGRH